MESISEIKKPKDFIKKLKSGSQVILLRHAESKQNEASKRLSSIEHTEEDILRHKTNFLSRDCSITELGKKQCESTAEITNKLKVEIVLVSPLKRTLQTAYHVFRSHPNFENIEFIVVPKLKEILSSISSVPKNIISLIKEYQSKFPNFDCSMLQEYEDPLHYFLEDIKDEFAKNILSKKTFDSEDCLGSNSVDLLLEYIQHIYPRKAESNKSALKRISKVKKYIHNLLQSKLNNSSSKMFSQESKIVVVTHGNIGKLWTGKWDKPLDEYEEIPMPSKCKTFDNCQLYADNKNFPRVKTHLS